LRSIIEVLEEEYKFSHIDIEGRIKERVSQRGSRSQTHYIEKKYKKFEEAWNTFQGIGLEAGCEDIIVQRMRMSCPFQFCCLTNKSTD
jgi:hypothetical protein